MERESIFLIGPNGSAQLDTAWHTLVTEFCLAMKIAVGSNVTVRLHPYRIGRTAYLAFDLKGDAGEVNMTIIESNINKLPSTVSTLRTREIECELTNMINANYLVASVLESLDAPCPKEFSSIFSGPKTITS